MLNLGLLWDKDDIKELVKDKDVIFEDEIKIARKANEMLEKGYDPTTILDTLNTLLSHLDYQA